MESENWQARCNAQLFGRTLPSQTGGLFVFATMATRELRRNWEISHAESVNVPRTDLKPYPVPIRLQRDNKSKQNIQEMAVGLSLTSWQFDCQNSARIKGLKFETQWKLNRMSWFLTIGVQGVYIFETEGKMFRNMQRINPLIRIEIEWVGTPGFSFSVQVR